LKNLTIEVVDIVADKGFDFSQAEIIDIESLKYGETKHLFFKINKIEDYIYSTTGFTIQLKYDVQEIDTKGNPHGTAYKDHYKIDKNVVIKVSDYYVTNSRVNLNNFEEYWKKAENSNFFLTEEKFQLPFPTIKAAAASLSNLLGFEPLNELDKLDVNVNKYEILYATVSYYESMVFIRLQILVKNAQCLARVQIRSQEEEVNEMLINSIS
jgi:hypothetical protein